jgi:hypothetical protein
LQIAQNETFVGWAENEVIATLTAMEDWWQHYCARIDGKGRKDAIASNKFKVAGLLFHLSVDCKEKHDMFDYFMFLYQFNDQKSLKCFISVHVL